MAIAVHPNDDRYSKYIGRHVLHPIRETFIPIIADSSIKREFGTGKNLYRKLINFVFNIETKIETKIKRKQVSTIIFKTSKKFLFLFILKLISLIFFLNY